MEVSMNIPEMHDVESSNVRKIGYDESSKSLYVMFNNGGLYKYEDVPKSVYDDLNNTESIGSFLSKQIKGRYSYERIG